LLGKIGRVHNVMWIEGREPVGLAIVLRPNGDDQLKKDLGTIKQNGVQTLVSLLVPIEAQWLGLADEGPFAVEAGMNFLSYPILDVHVPKNVVSFRNFAAHLADRLRAGDRIGVHCRGSIGRSTVTAACALMHLGWKPKEALAAIQMARGCSVPDTLQQRRWILKYKVQP